MKIYQGAFLYRPTWKMAHWVNDFYSRDATACKGTPHFARALIESWQMLEVAESIRYIHSEDVVHGDLRGVSFSYFFVHHPFWPFPTCQDNVLLDDNLRVKKRSIVMPPRRNRGPCRITFQLQNSSAMVMMIIYFQSLMGTCSRWRGRLNQMFTLSLVFITR